LEGERRRGALASASAYIIFTILSFGGLYLFFNARLADLETQTKNLQAEKQTLTSEAKERANRAERSKVSEEAALQILRQLQTGEREKALKAYQELDVTYLTPLESEILRAEVERRREALAEEYFTRGKDYYRSKQFKRAEEEFVASMQIQKESSRRPEILYYRGMIHYNLGRFPDAASELEKALAEDPKASWHGEAQYHLASAFEETKQLARAREGYLAYLKEFPKGFYSSLIKIKLANMK
jgi:TolA-binding protein